MKHEVLHFDGNPGIPALLQKKEQPFGLLLVGFFGSILGTSQENQAFFFHFLSAGDHLEHYPKQVLISREVKRPILESNEKPGDVDLLIIPHGRCEQAVAIECKRAKVTISDDGSEKVNKIRDIEKGLWQSRDLRNKGFYRTYLLVFIVTDGRSHRTPNTVFREGDGIKVKEIFQYSKHEELHADVGIIYFRITQPSNEHINVRGNIGICCDKPAVEIEQSPKMTERIRLHYYNTICTGQYSVLKGKQVFSS